MCHNNRFKTQCAYYFHVGSSRTSNARCSHRQGKKYRHVYIRTATTAPVTTAVTANVGCSKRHKGTRKKMVDSSRCGIRWPAVYFVPARSKPIISALDVESGPLSALSWSLDLVAGMLLCLPRVFDSALRLVCLEKNGCGMVTDHVPLWIAECFQSFIYISRKDHKTTGCSIASLANNG